MRSTLTLMPTYELLARRYHEQLPDHIREYLRTVRGLTDAVIDKYELGWNGSRIVIPIRDREGRASFLRLGKAPDDLTAGAKMLSSFGSRAELYGWDRVHAGRDRIIVCEGEFDRLLLESRGYAAVTSTAGALTFKKLWAEALSTAPSLYVCFDRDAAGDAGARRVAWFLPKARIVMLPPEVGHAGDVSDYFLGLGKTIEEFDALLNAARPLADVERIPPGPLTRGTAVAFQPTEASVLKAQVRIEDWVAEVLTLTVQGRNYAARCPFHEDGTPSFIVFPETQTFHCFGCRAHGDVFTFLMRTRGINFAAACEMVRRATHNTDGEAA